MPIRFPRSHASVGGRHGRRSIRNRAGRRALEMDKGKSSDTRIDRRTALRLAAGAGIAGAGGRGLAGPAQAATELSIWTGFPECAPFYQACADAYSKAHPEVKITIFSADLRSIEQKLSAA